MELTCSEDKTTVNSDGSSTTVHSDTLTINSPLQIGSFTATGMTPVGTIVAWVGGYFGDYYNGSYTSVLSADTIAAANSYLNPQGWYVCNGAMVNKATSPIWNAATRHLPNLTDDRFLMGSTAVSATAFGGSNTLTDHTHALSGSVAAEAAHTHSIAGVTVANESAHSHTWGGHWSIDDARYVDGGNGDGSGNTYSDSIASIGYWGTGWAPYGYRETGDDSPDHSHGLSDAYFAENRGSNVGLAGSTSGVDYDNDVISRWTYTIGANARHKHVYFLPSHRHWIMNRGTSAGSSHSHGLTGSVATGTSHTHSLVGGAAGTGATPLLTDNRPKYLKCFMIIRVV